MRALTCSYGDPHGPIAQLVEQRTLNPLADSSSLSWPTGSNFEELASEAEDDSSGSALAVCTSVCTPSAEEAALERAIRRLTEALGAADDDDVAAIVAERRQMREELAGLRAATNPAASLRRGRNGSHP